jgi:hypothetical protein
MDDIRRFHVSRISENQHTKSLGTDSFNMFHSAGGSAKNQLTRQKINKSSSKKKLKPDTSFPSGLFFLSFHL